MLNTHSQLVLKKLSRVTPTWKEKLWRKLKQVLYRTDAIPITVINSVLLFRRSTVAFTA